MKTPATIEQIKSLQPGDVFYLGSQIRCTVREFGTNGFSGEREVMVLEKRGRYVRYHWYTINRILVEGISSIVPKDKVRTYQKRKAFQYDFAASDGGRKEAGINERGDCTVRALANAFDIPYAEAHAHMAQHGRKQGKGAYIEDPYTAARFNGQKLVMVAGGYKHTVGAWIKAEALPKRCILKIRRHVFAVVDNKVLDTFRPGPRSRVFQVWAVVPE